MVLTPESDISVLINQLALAQNCQSWLPKNESELGLVFTWRTRNVKQMPNQHFLLNVTTTQPHTNMLHVSSVVKKVPLLPEKWFQLAGLCVFTGTRGGGEGKIHSRITSRMYSSCSSLRVSSMKICCNFSLQ